ncbi:MAG: OsmC family protein [Myxococcota bacterium]
MSEHRASVEWSRLEEDFTPSFSRDHAVAFGSGQSLALSATAEYRGNAERVNPEELLVAALASCHMLTFLALAARSGIVVDSYRDDASGVLERNAEGKMSVTRVTLRPQVKFRAEPPPSAQEQSALHEKAHRGCFIASSVKTEVSVELPIESG